MAKKTLIKGFEVTKSIPIPELDLHLTELRDEKTGAEVLHLKAKDPENVFCLSFKTIPKTSNGVAHILEHMVLCGSKNYPVKDPFFSMLRRSLNTFMNALTGSDFTCYPAATLVKKDFYNLLDVYLDAVFFPTLKKESFLQEGHRLEYQTGKDPKTPLEIKGIVYNEMKGALSSAGSRLSEEINAQLFPTITYGINSGGDPKVIPDLTYEELVNFHKEHYDPARCLFFFYGDLPLEGHLDFIRKKVLSKAKPASKLPLLPLEKRFTKPKSVKSKYPLSQEEMGEKKAYMSLGWLTTPIQDQQELLALSILQVMLMDTDASPLKMAILKSGLASQASLSLDSEISEAPLVLTLSGIEAKDAKTLEKTVFSTLEDLVAKGFSKKLIESAIHQFEFHRSEITGDHYPYGLILFFRSGLLKQHGVEPEEGLLIHTQIEKLKKTLKKNKRYFEELLKKTMLDNRHFVKVLMEPDPSLAKKELKEEKQRIQKIEKALSASQKKAIVKEALKLEKAQKEEEKQDINILPKLTLKDVPGKIRDYPLKEEKFGPLKGYYHTCFTNHITYTDLIFPLPLLPEEDLYLLRLFALLLPQIGLKSMAYEKFLNEVQASTGGIGASVSLQLNARDPNLFTPSLQLSGKCLKRNTQEMMHLMKGLAKECDFTNKKRIKEVLLKHWTSLDSRLTQSALRYAISLSTKGLSEPARINDAWFGLTYWQKMKALTQNLDQTIDSLVERLLYLQQEIFKKASPELIISGDESTIELLHSEDFSNFSKPSKEPKPIKRAPRKEKIASQGRVISAPVSSAAMALSLVPYADPRSPLFSLASSLLENRFLHQKIREEGGAYGGGATCYPLAGQFVFFSFRDPHIAATKKAFKDAVAKLAAGGFTKQDLTEAKLEAIQSQDSPVSPGSRADISYSFHKEGRTPTLRQEWRERLLKATKEEVVDVLKNVIAPKLEEAPFVAFAGKELFDKENALLKEEGEKPLPLYPLS
ncbi:insulinase family protein [Estrella lausannensis]|uniref:Metalloprotease n=1 Tax=Estrella lausannensis TaxID=483423 RepID=A0A0H5DS50_9BACT|nr:insulinase family protein [Estrella lausannensis]CRX39088.1 Metalloprotease [Estrella lausannensis]